MEPYAQTSDGVSIAFCVMGEGQPLVYTSNVWGDIHWYLHNEPTRREVDRLIASSWRVVRYDSRGFGSSDRDVTDLSLAARLKDLEAVVDSAEVVAYSLAVGGDEIADQSMWVMDNAERIVFSGDLGLEGQRLPGSQVTVTFRRS